MEQDFITQCLVGTAQPSEIDYFIKMWHRNHEGRTDLTLRRCLGMTEEEYSKWLLDSNAIYQILEERQGRINKN